MTNTYTNIFGGTPVQPAYYSYSSTTLTSNISLVWPKTGLQTDNVVADLMDVIPNQAGWIITMPDATQVSVGQVVTFNNLASDDTYQFFVYDYDGDLIANVPAAADGEYASIKIYLRDNTTQAGTWGVIPDGSPAESAQASQLAGYGLSATAYPNRLSTAIYVNEQDGGSGDSYTVQASDRDKLIVWKGGTGEIQLPSAAATGIGDGFCVRVNNASPDSGHITIFPNGSEKINNFSFFDLGIEESVMFVSDGSNWWTFGDGKESFFTVNMFQYTILPASPQTDIELSDFDASKTIQEFNSNQGDLQSDVNIVYPPAVNLYYVYNNTTGPYNLYIKTTGGTSILVPQGTRIIAYCDGQDLKITPTALTLSGLFPSGSAASPSISFQTSTSDGRYLVGVGIIGESIQGVKALTLDSSGLKTWNGTSVSMYNTVNGNYVGFTAPTSLSVNTTWKLPSADGTVGRMLTTDGATNLSWTTPTNIVQTVLNTTWDQATALNGTFYGVTGLFNDITTRTNTSKVLVQVSVTVSTDDAGAYINAQLERDATPIGLPAAAGSRTLSLASSGPNSPSATTLTFSYLDTPGAAGSYTYQVLLGLTTTDGTHSIYVNRDVSDTDSADNFRCISTITLTEVIA